MSRLPDNRPSSGFISTMYSITRKLAHKLDVFLNPYIEIPVGEMLIKFHRKGLDDVRGIGRVSHELFNQLKKQETKKRSHQATPIKTIYFYPTIHVCPVKLPHPSCILILDVIPMLFPDIYHDVAKEWTTRLKPIARQADKVLTISRSSASDISRFLDIPLQLVTVMYIGVTKLPVAANVTMSLPKGNFIVYLGAGDRHKNIEIVFRAMLEPAVNDISLVMIGRNLKAQSMASDLKLESRVHFLGQLDDEDTGLVLSKALALVCPSLYEGFGLPPLEAALLGTPSICSSRPAMTEILEGAALFASPDNPAEWAAAINKLRDDTKFRNNLGQLAQQRAREFQWERSAKILLEQLQKLC